MVCFLSLGLKIVLLFLNLTGVVQVICYTLSSGPKKQRQIEVECVMEDLRTAYFLYRPRRISDLLIPHLLEQEHPYTIVEEVRLSHIDYENFTEDLLADRAFLERYDGQLSVDGVYQCLLVREWNGANGLLVVPKDGFVFFAATIQG